MSVDIGDLFDSNFYTWKYPEVQAAVSSGQFKDPFQHYQMIGRDQGYQPSGYFDEEYYLEKYPDVAQAVQAGQYEDGLEHFLREGQFFDELRSPSELVDQQWIYDYTKEKNPEAASDIAEDDITGVEYFVDLPTGKEYEYTAERMFLGMWNDRNFDIIDQLSTGPEFIDHNVFTVLPGRHDGGEPGKLIAGPERGGSPGTQGIKQTAQLFLDTMPDLVLEQKDFASDGNKLMIRWESNGIQTEPFGLGYNVASGATLNEALNVPELTEPTPRKFQGLIVAYFNPEGKMEERYGYPVEHETTTNFLEMGVPLPGIQDRIQPVAQQQTELVQQTYEKFQTGDVQSVLNNLSDDVVWNSQYTSDIPFAGVYNGKEGVTDYLSKVDQTTDVLEFNPLQFVSQGNIVTVTGTERIRVESTGLEYTNNWVHIWELSGDKSQVNKITTYNDTAAVEAAFTGKTMTTDPLTGMLVTR